MKLAALTSIIIPENRQRREFDPVAHQELVAGIQDRQLLHAPVMRESGGLLYLVAGERRLRAIAEAHELGLPFKHNNELVPEGMTPYVTLGELSELEAEEAELEENVRRKDLTWQERVDAEARLVQLRQNQARARGETPASVIAPVTQELRGDTKTASKSSVSASVILANNMHRPEVKSAKSVTEAMKALQRSLDSERNAEAAKLLGNEFIGSKHKLVQGDFLSWAGEQPPSTFDVVCTDPPYGMGADEFGDSGGVATGAHFYNDSADWWETFTPKIVSAYTLLTKPQAHLYMFCDFDRFATLREWFKLAGWRVFRTPLIWHKPTAGRAPWPEHGPQRKYECILFAIKGDMRVTKLASDVLTYPSEENLGHPAQKPVALYADLLARSVRPGMQVLDGFCGTGPIFPAAHQLSVIATGVEVEPAAAGIAAGRIKLLKAEA